MARSTLNDAANCREEEPLPARQFCGEHRRLRRCVETGWRERPGLCITIRAAHALKDENCHDKHVGQGVDPGALEKLRNVRCVER